MQLIIDVNQIEKALHYLLQELRNQKGEQIEIEPVDFYWSIAPKDLYNPYDTPASFSLGQLTDDLIELKKLADGSSEPVSLDFVKISAILAAIGHKTNW